MHVDIFSFIFFFCIENQYNMSRYMRMCTCTQRERNDIAGTRWPPPWSYSHKNSKAIIKNHIVKIGFEPVRLLYRYCICPFAIPF